jgi:ligand-binding sensor protein
MQTQILATHVTKLLGATVLVGALLSGCGGGGGGATGPAGAGVTWVNVTGTSQQAASNTGYIANNAAQVTITLPPSPAFGDVIQVSGVGAGGWKIAQNAGQSILTQQILGIGASWTAPPGQTNRNWQAVASSADGNKLVAAASGGLLYTSTDSGVTWTGRAATRNWKSVASAADGSKLVAVVLNGQIYTSTDSGVTWIARDQNRIWTGVASSTDGSKLVAVVTGGQIYTSTDSGLTWTAHDSSRGWQAVASSADGSKLVAAVSNGQIYTSAGTMIQSTTAGTAGSISGVQYDAIELQYIGNGTFMVLSYTGYLAVQ